jgi:type I restriction enzyme S subunit
MADQITTIPKGWKMTTLGKVADVIGGGTPKTDVSEYWGGKIPWLSVVDFNDDGRWVYKTEKTITEQGLENSSTRLLNAGDIIISARGTVGAFAQLKYPMAFNQSCYGLKAKENSEINFLYYLLIQNIQLVKKNVHGAVFDTITRNTFDQITVDVPPLPEQRAIAVVLSSLDDKIELLREQNKTLEATAQAIFKEWFVNFNFPNKEGKPYKASGGKMIDSDLGEIPEGWRVGGLIEDKITKFVKTTIDDFDGTKDYVETSNVNLSNFVGNFEKVTFSDRPIRANIQPVENSFWFARMSESRKYLLFQEKDDIESKILSTGFAGVQSIKEYLYFYWCYILSDIFNSLKNQYAEGAVQVAISNGGIQRIKLALPSIEVAKKFTEAVGFCFEKISNNNSQIETLSKLRDTLLPKLMKGEVRVKGFEN